ncbi:MAG: T9SS type A sorting domain-containing protein [Ignavibacteriaceae bacterium]|nr:T9SS type A sorting domain-containing protein [Ignavibacteriaceae bacterium]
MKNIKSLSCLLIILMQSVSLSQWISLDKNNIPNSQPKVQLISDNDFITIIKVEISGFQINEFSFEGKKYQSISFNSEAATTQVGFPEIPHIAKILAIPDQGNISVEVLETSAVQTIKGINIPPARESWIEGEPETPYVEYNEAYQSEELYPGNFATVENPAVFRDFRIARVSIFPIRYSPARKEIQAVTSITIKINYTPGSGINPKTTLDRPIAPSFAKLYRNFIFNYEEVLQRKYNGMESGYDFMLCIMPDEFVNSFQAYAAWRQKTGTYIHITKFSEIGATGNNPTAVKDHILDSYNNWQVAPTHVLLIGDAGIAPIKLISYDYTFAYDDYFVELEGNDFIPEMMIGRFTNQTDYRLQVMINKFLGYEKTPYVQDVDWFKKGLVCANDAYASQRETKRFTAQQMLLNGNFISVDSMYNGYPCPGNVATIVNMINNGRSYLNYRGEGWSSGWWASCFQFQTSNVSSLNNGQKLTFVTSIGCGVAMFNASGGNCFGEEWVQLGTLTEPRGACAFVGPTSNTHTTYNNKIDMGIYTGMFQQMIPSEPPMDSPGEALLNGKMFMYSVFGNTMWVEYHFRIYHVLGDPSLHVWKATPLAVNVSHPDTVINGFNQIQITVNYSTTGLPVPNAQICISGNDVYELSKTNLNGIAMINISPSLLGELSITVRGGTVIPYEGTMQVVQGIENVALFGNPVVTDTDGNLDGLINPNENGTITFTLKNYGTQTANNVSAVLSVPDSINIVQVITTNPVSFGNIGPDQSVTGAPFQFFVKPECAVGFTIPFKLTVTSETSNWVYYYILTVHGCQLVYIENIIDDEGNILRNYRMDPGETVKVFLKIKNAGDDVAPEVNGILRSTDEYITILDSVGTFNTILKDSSAINNQDYFIVKVSETCPVQYDALYSVLLSTQNGLYPYSNINSFTISVAMPSGFDPTGPDAYGYYAYSSDDVLFEQSPQYDWVEINSTGTLFPRPAGNSNFTQTISLPFNFKYYGNNFSQVRISTDGWIALGNGTQIASQNFPLPKLDDIKNMVCPFWDDLFSTYPNETGKIYYFNDAANHRFVIEWDKVKHATDTLSTETFQVLLLDPVYYPTQTGDGEIIFQYKIVEEAGGNTVGIEDNTETIALQYVFDDIYSTTATELRNNYAIKFTTNSPTIVSVNEDDEVSGIPDNYILEQNYPNPFNPETHISYSIPEQAFVKLCIYDINGILVRTLYEGDLSAGRYHTVWNGENSSGFKVGSGVYFYRIQANSFVQTRKMILLK